MIQICQNLAIPLVRFSTTKVYYPALLSPNYSTIEYDPFYVILLSISVSKSCKDVSCQQEQVSDQL
jgi:hypothetical protein